MRHLSHLTSPNPFCGPKTCMIAPKSSIDTKKLMVMVQVTRTANLLKMMTLPPKRKTPEPKVVILPLKILTPISVYAYFILSFLLW